MPSFPRFRRKFGLVLNSPQILMSSRQGWPMNNGITTQSLPTSVLATSMYLTVALLHIKDDLGTFVENTD
jgi:hypothetical protein